MKDSHLLTHARAVLLYIKSVLTFITGMTDFHACFKAIKEMYDKCESKQMRFILAKYTVKTLVGLYLGKGQNITNGLEEQ